MRLNPNCNTFEETIEYYKERSIQLLLDSYTLHDITDYKEYCIATYYKYNIKHHSIYIYNDYRNKGVYKKALNNITDPNIITSKDCEIIPYLEKYNIKYVKCLEFTETVEYKAISSIYGTDVSNRSKVPFMNHIDEGLAILHWIGASYDSKRGYCLHPIHQSDIMFIKYGLDLKDVESKVLINSVEYRSVANNYLSTRIINSLDDIKLSPLQDVNDMLIADKIQNRKDFEIYHKVTHKRSEILTEYFNNWLERLNITEETFNGYKFKLLLNFQINSNSL